MAKAFTFWEMPQEESHFLDFLDTTGTVVAYPHAGVQTHAEASPAPLRSFLIDTKPPVVLLSLESGTSDVVTRTQTHADKEYFVTDLMSSCVIAYSRPLFRSGTCLGQSNLAAYLDFFKDDPAQQKPDWFQAWVKQVFSWAKKRANQKCVHQGFSYPATTLVVNLVEEKQIKVVL